LLVLSCQDDVVNSVKEDVIKYPDHPITYEFVKDSITIHRVYPSRFRVDSITLDQVVMKYRKLKTISFAANDTVFYDSIQREIDTFNQLMVDKHIYEELAPIHIYAADSVLIEDVFYHVIKPINNHSRTFAINSHTFTVREDKNQGCSEIIFREESLYIEYEAYGFNEKLTVDNHRILDSLHKVTAELLSRNNRGGALIFDYLSPHRGSYCFKTDDSPITIFQALRALSSIDTNPIIHFEFKSSEESSNSSSLWDYYGNSRIGFYNNIGREKIRMELDSVYTLDSEYPYTQVSTTFLDNSDTTLLQYNLASMGSGLQVNWERITPPILSLDSGFVIHKYDVLPFLEEKLKILGFNNYERVDFRRHWVKEIAKNEYSLIHFATDEYEEAIPMIVTPEPETKIRILMCFKAVDSSFQIPEQVLTPVVTDRSGFTVVEWGGCNYDRDQVVQ